MKGIIVFFVVFFMGVYSLSAQQIYSCNDSEADFFVYVTQYKNEADLIVYKCFTKSDANGNNGRWFYVKSKLEANKNIYFAEYKYEADLLIYFTNKKGLASWKNYSKKHLLQ